MLLTTATSGVGDHDELILVRVADPEEGQEHTFYRQVSAENVLKTQEYTGIQVEDISRRGMADEAFKAALQDVCQDKLLLTYNVPFQLKYLAPYVELKLHSLPLWFKATGTRLPADEQDIADAVSLDKWAARSYGKDPTFKSVTKQLGIDPWNGTGLYVDWTTAAMRLMWGRMGQVGALVQGCLF